MEKFHSLTFFHISGEFLAQVFWGHFMFFVCLLFVATIGKKFGIRRRYISLLDRLFVYAASKLDESHGNTDEGEGEEEDLKEEGVIISPEAPVVRKPPDTWGHFTFEDSIPYITAGMQAIVEDCINKSFTPKEHRTWNMLSRTKKKRKVYKSRSLTLLWLLGFFFRYVFLVPVRLAILVISLVTLVTSTYLVGKLPDGSLKREANAFVLCWCLDFVASALSVVARFHNKEHRPTHGIAVANHTSPIDSMVLATDNCYDMVGQKTNGFLGVFMNALSKSSTHIWFERTSESQRTDATKRLLWHAQNKALPPVLIFPEGICVNNTAVLLFRKGVFELDADIHPIVIKFDSRYGDAFWHQRFFFAYCMSMLTSWAIVCDVWYLPPMSRNPEESSIDFANRVKSAIARKGGLEELNWDGFIKVINGDKEKMEQRGRTWLKRQQFEFAKHLQRSDPDGTELTARS